VDSRLVTFALKLRSRRNTTGRPKNFGLSTRPFGWFCTAAMLIGVPPCTATAQLPTAVQTTTPAPSPTVVHTTPPAAPRTGLMHTQSLPLGGPNWGAAASHAHLFSLSLPTGFAARSARITESDNGMFSRHLALIGQRATKAHVFEAGFLQMSSLASRSSWVYADFEQTIEQADAEKRFRFQRVDSYALFSATFLSGQCFEVADGRAGTNDANRLYVFDLCNHRILFAKSLNDDDWGPKHNESFFARYVGHDRKFTVSIAVDTTGFEEISLGVPEDDGGRDGFMDTEGKAITEQVGNAPRIAGWSMMQTFLASGDRQSCSPVQTGAGNFDGSTDDGVQLTKTAPTFPVLAAGVFPGHARVQIAPPLGTSSAKTWSVEIGC